MRETGNKLPYPAHLHVRSGFSYGLGTATPEELVEGAARLGYGAMALTDRDGMYGIPRFLTACDAGGLSPIVGAEITVQLRKRGRKHTGGYANGHLEGHLVLLAYSAAGYASLCRLLSTYRGGLPGDGRQRPSAERRNPVCDLTTLLEHAEGLLCLTGAIPYGLMPRLVLAKDTDAPGKAHEVLALLLEAFGSDNLYVELTDDETAGSRRRMAAVDEVARRSGLPTVATGEVTYLRPQDHRLSEILAAAWHLTPLPPPAYRTTDRLYLRPPETIVRLFYDRPEALKGAAKISERCAGAVRLGAKPLLPEARGYAGKAARQRLISLTRAGARRCYPEATRNEPDAFPSQRELRKRLRRELSVIFTLGFEGYFLIAHEVAEIAWDMNIPLTGRGSAANSVVCHTLGLTQPEPFAERLLFERFLHDKRNDPADIDLDVCSELRDSLRNELMRRYQKQGVAVAATANTLSLRGAVRAASRALGYSPSETDELAKNVPRRIRDRDRTVAYETDWDTALSSPAMNDHPLQDRRRYALLMELAGELEGKLSQPGTHLGGLVFAPGGSLLSEVVPLEMSGTPGLVRTQYDKDDLETVLRMPKLDLLGLRTHTSLRKAGELVSGKVGRRIDPLSPPPDDKETYQLIRSGRTVGCFQLESPGQQSLQRRLGARRISDVTAGVALFRPGPLTADMVTPYVQRRNSREPYEVPLPEIDDILRPTYGVMVFQEQLMEIASRLSGITFADADLLRRAMTGGQEGGGPNGGNGTAQMRRLARRFVRQAVARGISPKKAREVFGLMEGFGRYGFSAAHAASFAHISYASAYMLAHHPAEAYAGILNARPGMYSPRVILNEARRRGVAILPPDVHLSGRECTVECSGQALRVGLAYCRGLSDRALEDILAERRRKLFTSVADFYQRTSVTRDALQNLILGGFLDILLEQHQSQSQGRREMLSTVGGLPAKGRLRGNDRQEELPLAHPASWWSGLQTSPVRELAGTFSRLERGREELRVLGLNVHAHPLADPDCREALGAVGIIPSREILELPQGSRARAAGILESLQSPPTKSGRPIWFLQIEDEQGLLQTTIFRDVYQRYGHVLYETGAYVLDGRVERDPRRGFSFVVGRIAALEPELAGIGEKKGSNHGDGQRRSDRPGELPSAREAV